MRKVFLDDLPRGGTTGVGDAQINWNNSIGYKIRFIYDYIEGWIQIIDYKDRNLYIKYLDKKIFKIFVSSFLSCNLGNLLKIEIKIGQIFKDDKRDITIINREYRYSARKDGYVNKQKWYKYHCNKCNSDSWIIEGSLNKGVGCGVCCPTPRVVALGYNTIWDTDRWMCDLGVSEEDAKTHTSQSNDKIYVTCSNCGKIKTILISNIYKRHSIGCSCSDKISYPNKFSYSLLYQLNEIYKFDYIEHEYNPEWIDKKSYDNYFIYNGKGYVLEMDGGWHKTDNSMSGQTKEESKAIDDYKDRMAREHGMEVIRIDCGKSELEFIRQNILNSKLSELFDLNSVHWEKCEEFALSNLIKEVCVYKNSNPNMTTTQIGENMRLGRSTIREYLKKGTNLGWCDYNAKREKSIVSSNNGKLNSRPIEIFKDGVSLGEFPSCRELERKSEEIFGIKLNYGSISLVCLSKQKQYKGFTFKYINEIEHAI